MKKILYFTRHFPCDDAPTQRIEAVSRLFEKSGYNVEIAISQPYCKSDKLNDWNGRMLHLSKDLCFQENQKVKRNIERLSSINLNTFAETLIEKVKPDVVLLYGGGFKFAYKLLFLRKKYNFVLMADETDWFEPELSSNIVQYFITCSANKRIKDLDKNFDAVIATSPFFRSYFSERATPAFFLPSVFPATQVVNIEDQKWANSPVIEFVYAGNLHAQEKKDMISPLLRAIDTLPSLYKNRIRVTIIGPSFNELAKVIDTRIIGSDFVRLVGPLPHQKVLEELKTKHFGVLFRHNQLYAKAGFSTKFGECMLNGVPMICNSVGGADLLINNWVDGIVLPDAKDETIRSALCDICELSPSELLEMRKAAISTANSRFLLDNYYKPFSTFIHNIVR